MQCEPLASQSDVWFPCTVIGLCAHVYGITFVRCAGARSEETSAATGAGAGPGLKAGWGAGHRLGGRGPGSGALQRCRSLSRAPRTQVGNEVAAESAHGDNFITWHIRQWMDDPAAATAKFYKHVADRKAAADHVLTAFASPIKTDGFWRQPQNNWATIHNRAVPAKSPYDVSVANLEKLS